MVLVEHWDLLYGSLVRRTFEFSARNAEYMYTPDTRTVFVELVVPLELELN